MGYIFLIMKIRDTYLKDISVLVREYIMECVDLKLADGTIPPAAETIHCEEYESGYVSDYDGLYNPDIVFYDDSSDEEDDGIENSSDEYEDEDYDSDDLILEEVPFVYCPPRGEVGEA